jgi:hypothetical protein
MSLNRLLSRNSNSIRVDSVTAGAITYSGGAIPAQGDGLKLIDNDDKTYKVEWSPIDQGASLLYTNQSELSLRSASYSVDNSEMFFDGFKYTHPSYVNLRNDKKAIIVNNPGWYMATFTIASNTLNTSSKYELTVSDLAIAASTISSTPSALGYGSADQIITTTSSFIFKTTGFATIQLLIVPTIPTYIVGEFSNFVLLRLRNLIAPPPP